MRTTRSANQNMFPQLVLSLSALVTLLAVGCSDSERDVVGQEIELFVARGENQSLVDTCHETERLCDTASSGCQAFDLFCNPVTFETAFPGFERVGGAVGATTPGEVGTLVSACKSPSKACFNKLKKCMNSKLKQKSACFQSHKQCVSKAVKAYKQCVKTDATTKCLKTKTGCLTQVAQAISKCPFNSKAQYDACVGAAIAQLKTCMGSVSQCLASAQQQKKQCLAQKNAKLKQCTSTLGSCLSSAQKGYKQCINASKSCFKQAICNQLKKACKKYPSTCWLYKKKCTGGGGNGNQHDSGGGGGNGNQYDSGGGGGNGNQYDSGGGGGNGNQGGNGNCGC